MRRSPRPRRLPAQLTGELEPSLEPVEAGPTETGVPPPWRSVLVQAAILGVWLLILILPAWGLLFARHASAVPTFLGALTFALLLGASGIPVVRCELQARSAIAWYRARYLRRAGFLGGVGATIACVQGLYAFSVAQDGGDVALGIARMSQLLFRDPSPISVILGSGAGAGLAFAAAVSLRLKEGDVFQRAALGTVALLLFAVGLGIAGGVLLVLRAAALIPLPALFLAGGLVLAYASLALILLIVPIAWGYPLAARLAERALRSDP